MLDLRALLRPVWDKAKDGAEKGDDVKSQFLPDGEPEITPSPHWNARFSHKIPHTIEYYKKCMIGGAFAGGITHLAVTPLDVAKCNMQVDPETYKSMLQTIGLIIQLEGYSGIWKGWLPTLIGYAIQNVLKFGLYEIFKDYYSTRAGEKNSRVYRGLIYVLASLSAEFFADIALCPFEMVKVKVQTSPSGTFPVSFWPALFQMYRNADETRFPFGSLVPLWTRQIPYTIAKFFFFEKTVSFFYNYIFLGPRNSYSKKTKLGITFASGYIAGIICALVSHPADTLVSQLGKSSNEGLRVSEIVANVGLYDLMTKGLGTRIIMIGTLTGLQWWIYDTFKVYSGIGTSGGS